MHKLRPHGFTIMELLVVIAFSGLLISVVVFMLGSLRFKNEDIQKLSDARRLSDITQLRTGLEQFYSSAGGYPDSHMWETGQTIVCGNQGIIQVPRALSTGQDYLYQSRGKLVTSQICQTKVWSDYSIQFQTETKSYLGPAGTYCLTPSKGIVFQICP